MINKKKMIIVVSAIALVAAISAGIYSVANNAKTVSNEVAYAQIEDDDVPLGIKGLFDDAIKSYYKDGLSYDEMLVKIETDLKEYIDNTGNFTTEQTEQLNAIIREYLNDSVIYPDADKNDEAIKTITALINERYTQNYNYIASVEQSIKDIAKTGDDRYKELTDMDKRLKRWLDESAENQRKDLNEAYNKSHTELAATTEDLKTLIDDLAKTAKSDNSASYELIKAITGANDFDSSKTYNKGDIIISNGSLYMATADGVNNLSDFEATDLNTSVLTLNREFNSSIDEMKVYTDELNVATNERIDTLESTTDDKFNSLTNKDADLEKSISDNAALSANEREALLSEINSLKREISDLKTDIQENYINKNDLTFNVNGDDLTITKNY